MPQPYPLPRSYREAGPYDFDGVSKVYGPFGAPSQFSIFDAEDVVVEVRESAAAIRSSHFALRAGRSSLRPRSPMATSSMQPSLRCSWQWQHRRSIFAGSLTIGPARRHPCTPQA